MAEACEQIRQTIDANAARYAAVADRIWEYAELGLKEHRSAGLLTEELKAAGFRVTAGLSGMETAFLAEYGEGRPVIAMAAEYDALPGLGQEAACPAQRSPAAGAPGHGCGHNVMGTAILAAAIGLKAYMETHALSGTLRVIGTPAEETLGAKAFLVRDGLFSDVDACIGVHSAWFNAVQNYGMVACRTIRFRFEGKAAHAGTAPHLGRSALDACELMNVGVNYLREHVRPSVRMSYCYEDAGGLADNVVPAHACVRYGLRAESAKELLEVSERVTDIARGAALMTGTRLSIEPVMAMADFVRNDTLGRACAEAMAMAGGPDFDEADEALARKFFDLATPGEVEASIQQLCLCDPEGECFSETPLVRDVAPYRPTKGFIGGGSDIGDVTYVTPTAHFLIATCAVGTPYHSWRMTAQSGSSIAHKGMLFGAKAMALAGVRMLRDPALLAEAREELLRKTGGKQVSLLRPDQRPVLS